MTIDERLEALTHSVELIALTQQKSEDRMKETDRRLDNLTSVVASLVLTAQAQQASIEELRTQWRETLERFDVFLRGRGGNGGTG